MENGDMTIRINPRSLAYLLIAGFLTIAGSNLLSPLVGKPTLDRVDVNLSEQNKRLEDIRERLVRLETRLEDDERPKRRR